MARTCSHPGCATTGASERCDVHERRRGRRKKSPDERLVPLNMNLEPDIFDMICKMARRRGEKPSVLARKIMTRCLRSRVGSTLQAQNSFDTN